jgi:hypothetical protein
LYDVKGAKHGAADKIYGMVGQGSQLVITVLKQTALAQKTEDSQTN